MEQQMGTMDRSNQQEKTMTEKTKAETNGKASNLEPAEAQSQVAEQMSHLANGLQDLEAAVVQMEQTLVPVLVLYDPNPEKPEDVKERGLVPLAATLRGYVYRVNGLTSHLHDIKDRTEL